jgi:NADH:ubiquinone oxidoreductase subunit 3 (subunit A)
MSDILFLPPIAFVIYFVIIALLSGLGRLLTQKDKPTSAKHSTYAGGEAAPQRMAAPGYKPFFVIALFFAILHLGVLIMGSGGISWSSGVYLVGLILALFALIMG